MTTNPAESLAATIDLGIFARVFPSTHDARALANTISAHGFSCVQLNLVALGYSTIPTQAELEDIDFARIRRDFADAGLSVWGLSATYNMAHPDPDLRADLSRRTAAMITRAPELGARAVSLCTGTRDPDNQWRAHPDNNTASAWQDMRESFDVLIAAADAADVMLAVEPEPANIIRDTEAGVRLVEDLDQRAAHLGFILDPANLVAEHDPSDYQNVLDDAFARLGSRTICVHAKDVVTWGERLNGRSGLDFDHVARLHAGLPARVPIIIQDTEPEEVDAVREMLLAAAAQAAGPQSSE